MMKKRTSRTGLMLVGWAMAATGVGLLAALYFWPAPTITLVVLAMAIGAFSSSRDR
jgi:hypothetical protein